MGKSPRDDRFHLRRVGKSPAGDPLPEKVVRKSPYHDRLRQKVIEKSPYHDHFQAITGKNLPSDTLRERKPREKSRFGHLPEAAEIVSRPSDDPFQPKVVRKFPLAGHFQLKSVVQRKFHEVLFPAEGDGKTSR